MNDSVRYLIAQYIADPFRQEPRNIGVIVQAEGGVRAQFVGESEPGTIDGRKLRGMAGSDVYRQWVAYWRTALGGGPDSINGLVDALAINFRVIPGGELAGGESIDDAARYLYTMLVSEGGFADAVGGISDSEAATARLAEAIEEELREINILARADAEPALVRHPVRRNVSVPGRAVKSHRPAFVQENGRLYVMETVDFSKDKERAKDHSGLAGYMFNDLHESRDVKEPAVAIALVRYTEEDQDHGAVRYGLSILKNTADEIVNWTDQTQRSAFIAERRSIALA